MANHFYAYISRMRCVKRWALMRNTEAVSYTHLTLPTN